MHTRYQDVSIQENRPVLTVIEHPLPPKLKTRQPPQKLRRWRVSFQSYSNASDLDTDSALIRSLYFPRDRNEVNVLC